MTAILRTMGYDPHRKFRASRVDYVLVAAAIVAAVVLLVWALTG